jgi:O-antigen ligase
MLLFSIIFFLLHVFGLAWTEDLSWGIHIVRKMWYFILLLPILFTIVQKKYVKLYITSFLLAISLTEILSYLVWFELIDEFKNASVYNPTPFMSHISYNPILSFAIYLVMYELLLQKDISRIKMFFYSFFALTMSINMFITGGRAGQIMYFAVILILSIQFFNKNKIKAIISSAIIIPTIFFIAYNSSAIFNERVDLTVKNVINYSENRDSSVGTRITYAINSWEIIMSNPVLGVGTGDFPTEHNKINKINSPEVIDTKNPHNMYILVLTQLGLLGLISFLSIFYAQLKFAFQSNDLLSRNVGVALPFLFLLIMFSDSYLLGHYTTLMFVFFSSFLYKNFEKN